MTTPLTAQELRQLERKLTGLVLQGNDQALHMWLRIRAAPPADRPLVAAEIRDAVLAFADQFVTSFGPILDAWHREQEAANG